MTGQAVHLSAPLVVTMDRERRIISDGGVLIKGNKIVLVGKSKDIAISHREAERLDFPDQMIIPGLIDAHNHPAHFLTKGLLDDVETGRRWATRLYPFENAVSEEETYWGALGTFTEMLKTGTTCVSDPGCLHPAAVVRAAQDSGIRACISAVVSDVYDPVRPWNGRHTAVSATRKNEELHAEYDGAASGRIRIWLGLWSPTTTSDALVSRVVELAEKLSTGIHGHLASKPGDNEHCLKRYGLRAVPRYHALGALSGHLLAAHMGAIDDDDVALVQAAGVNVVHCASASMLGAFGCISHGKFPELIANGVTVVLGTDAASISRFLDMAREMYLAACAHKDVRMDAELIGAHKAMEMATIDGARALLLGNDIGSIEPGKKADLVTVRMDGFEWQPRPRFNPIANFVYSSGGHRVATVMIDGKILLREGELTSIDEKNVRSMAEQAARNSAERAGIATDLVWPIH